MIWGPRDNEILDFPVSTDPEVLGRTPCFRGTRVPISVLFENLLDMGLTEFLEHYPSIDRPDAEVLLRWCQVRAEAEAAHQKPI